MKTYARIKGGKELKKWHAGEKLSCQKAILAKCYECNGEEESGVDCEVEGCPLYGHHPHRGRATRKKGVTTL